jgi:hypothetical protein
VTAPAPAVEPDDNPDNHRQVRFTITATEAPAGTLIDFDVEHRFGREPSTMEVLGLLEFAKAQVRGFNEPTCRHEVLYTDGCLKCGRVIYDPDPEPIDDVAPNAGSAS